jgi:chromosomal replication initiation ATPase DnaA
MNTHQHLMDTLVDATCREFGVSPHVLLGRSRADAEAKARHALAAALRSTGMSFHRIGELMLRGHTTAMHSCKVSRCLFDTDRRYRDRAESLVTLAINHVTMGGDPTP